MNEFYDFDDRKMRGTLRDWRKALRTPATYRVGNTVRVQPQSILLIMLTGIFLIVLFYYNWWTSNQVIAIEKLPSPTASQRRYNATYPLTTPIRSGNTITFRIGIVTDLDKASKSETKAHTYYSYYKKGFLSYNPVKQTVQVTWDNVPPTILSSNYANKGRGMELSELIVYDGRLLTFDDRSGMVFEIVGNKVVVWAILADGNGFKEKGFKSEWATIKDDLLYIGSMGKEWTTPSGEFVNHDPMWVKVINIHGEVHHTNWVNQYKSVRSAIGIDFPGYMIHESGVWSPHKEMWYFLPRRCSHTTYNETTDEVMGCNYLISTDADFRHVYAKEITNRQPKLGFSSFKFIPETGDEAIVALKTTEFEGQTTTYITAFTTDGNTLLLHDTLVDNHKYEEIGRAHV